MAFTAIFANGPFSFEAFEPHPVVKVVAPKFTLRPRRLANRQADLHWDGLQLRLKSGRPRRTKGREAAWRRHAPIISSALRTSACGKVIQSAFAVLSYGLLL